ncbi:hypothetical protein WJX74_006986 [Apatococcus lobatus]|uniref:AsmA-like C-terminal domain-containing protein n=1 Tax=Apatococcus lobatus TaxID=904363 RepID=A0AAW1QTX6_9CHLO
MHDCVSYSKGSSDTTITALASPIDGSGSFAFLAARPFSTSRPAANPSPASASKQSNASSSDHELNSQSGSGQGTGNNGGGSSGTRMTAASGPDPSANRSWARIVTMALKAVAGLAVVFIILAVAGPSIISTGPGLAVILAFVNLFFHGSVHVDKVCLSWTKPLDISGLELRAPRALGESPVGRCEGIRSQASLWDMLMAAWGRQESFSLGFQKPSLDLAPDAAGQPRISHFVQAGSTGRAQLAAVDAAKPDVKDVGRGAEPLTDMAFSAEAHLPFCEIWLADGSASVSEDIQQLIGKDLHITAVLGRKQLEEKADDLGLDTQWLTDASAPSTGLPLPGLGGKAEPAAVQVNSQRIQASGNGWWDGSRLHLHEPLEATLDYTPAVTKFFLARASPLLADIVKVGEGGQVHATVSPEEMRLPSAAYTIRVDPLRLTLGRGILLDRLVNILQAGQAKGVGDRRELKAWTSHFESEFGAAGRVTTKRLDLLLGPNASKGLHVAMWGWNDVANSQMNMTLGVPASGLAWAGIQGLPEGTMLPINVGGSSANPRVDWAGASRQIGSWALQSQARPDEPGQQRSIGSRLMRRGLSVMGKAMSQGGRSDSSELEGATDAPAPLRPLPWDD